MDSLSPSIRKPSTLLALVCLGIVHRLRRNWVALDIKRAADREGVSPERVSRLVSRALPCFERTMRCLVRRGRPPRDHRGSLLERELVRTRSLLSVASAILKHVKLRRSAVGALVIGSFRRLAGEQRITQKQFCDALGLSPRTLRHWLSTNARLSQPPPPRDKTQPRKRRRPPRRPRFSFDIAFPETQFAADTSNLQAFGVPLKLIASQDVGGRHQNLLDSVLVSQEESADLVVELLKRTLLGRPGAQLITDQGTPYLAEKTREALEELDVEHAVQKEADPTAKATIERAFLTAKSIARPLLSLTNRLSETIPSLKDGALARAAAILVLTTILRAYQAGARATRRTLDLRGTANIDALARRAEQSRVRARADFRSTRLLLADIHAAYGFPGRVDRFIRTFRKMPLRSIQYAEKVLSRCMRDPKYTVRNPPGFFATVVRDHAMRFYEEQEERLRRDRKTAVFRKRLFHEMAEREAHFNFIREHPAKWLARALRLLASSFDPEHDRLFLGGLGFHSVRGAWQLLLSRYAGAARDVASSVFSDFAKNPPKTSHPKAIPAVEKVLHQIMRDVKLPARQSRADSNRDLTTKSGLHPLMSILDSIGKPKDMAAVLASPWPRRHQKKR